MVGIPIYLSLALALTMVANVAQAQDSPVVTTNAAFQASLDRIAKRSPSWRDALDRLRASGRRAVVVTPDQVVVQDGSRLETLDRSDATLLAEVSPVVFDGHRVEAVVVVVNLALLEARYREQPFLPIELDMDLDRILVHEIYGHAIPYLLAGSVTGRCADPQPRERAVDACAIRRENDVRAELGLGRRVDYGLDGLNLSRQLRLRR